MWWEDIFQDGRFTLRTARRNLGPASLAVFTLALGIGATTAIFSVFKAVVLDRLPYRDPDRVVALSEIDPAGPTREWVGGWTANEWRTRSRSFDSISLYGDGSRILIENGESEVLRGFRVNYDFFETLGVRMMLGRSFHQDEDRWPRANVAIFSYGLWKRRFGGDPHIIGRTLNLSTESYRVIGVLPQDFDPLRMSNPAERPEIFMPLGYDAREALTCRGCFGGSAIGRLKPGVSIAVARAELDGIMQSIAREYPSDYGRDASALVEPLRTRVVGSTRTALWVLMIAVIFVLLIVCANVANLLLARAAARSREIAVRVALGVSRWRLIRQLLTESVTLALAGGGIGVLLAWWGIPILIALAPKELPRMDEVRMDVSVLLFAAALSLIAGPLFGIFPAVRASSFRLSNAPAPAGGRLRRALMISEIALAFVLATGTALLAKSLLKLTAVDAGFDPHNVLTLTPTLTGARYATPDAILAYYRQLIEKVRAVPGVLSAAMISNVPMSHTEPWKLRIEGQPHVSDPEAPAADVFWISPDYFRTLKIPLKRGRFFTNQDGVGQASAAIVSESLVRSRFLDGQAIGRRIQLGPEKEHAPWFTIVGIVGDVRNDGLDREPDQAVYVPQSADPDHYTRLVARTAGDPMSFASAVRAAIREVDPLQAIFHVQPMEDYVGSYLAGRSFTLTLIGLFGAMALVLAAVGVYGVISYSVGLRTREMGIRMSLGAERSGVVNLILRDVLVLLAWGLGAGFLFSLVLMRFLSRMLFEVRPADPAASAIVALVVACAALFAAYFPALRAASVDPASALRSE